MIIMSKYNPLWKWINKNKTDDFKLTFAEIENIAGVPIDHSFLTFKKELLQYGFKVVKISMKEQTVDFEKVKEEAKTWNQRNRTCSCIFDWCRSCHGISDIGKNTVKACIF